MTDRDETLNVAEVASELRCSKAYVYKAIEGKVTGVSKLPAIRMGRRKLVLRSALECWKRTNNGGKGNGMLASSLKVDAVDA